MSGRGLIRSAAGKVAALKVQFPLRYNAAIEAAGRSSRSKNVEDEEERRRCAGISQGREKQTGKVSWRNEGAECQFRKLEKVGG